MTDQNGVRKDIDKTNLLYSNDQPGRYPPSWYSASVNQYLHLGPLWGHRRVETCVIGAGFSGLSAALHLAVQGKEVLVVEAHKPGWGASGRNGGQLGSGQRVDQSSLEKMLGRDQAKKLWTLAEDSKALVKSLIANHGIDCEFKPGIVHANHRARFNKHSLEEVTLLNNEYGYSPISYLDRDQIRQIVGSTAYHGGTLDTDSGHLHPLNYCLGLGSAAIQAGAEIVEQTPVVEIEQGSPHKIVTPRGVIVADRVILACNGYLGGLDGEIEKKVMPINNFVVATRRLEPALAQSVLSQDVAVADSKFVVNYFRLSGDRRLLFGGRESYGYKFPKAIVKFVRKPLEQIFPQLKDIWLEYAWGGTLAITRNRLPCYVDKGNGVMNISGYSGHGVGMATLAGKLVADKICGNGAAFDQFSSLDLKPFPGGSKWRSPLLVAGMLYHSLLDKV